MRYMDLVGRILIVLMLCMFAVNVVHADTPAPATGKFSEDFIGACNYAGAKYNDCKTCAQGNGVWTAFGCVHPNGGSMFNVIFPIFMGMAGGIAFLLILFGGFQILMSAGNPEKMNEGRELITSAIAGLLLIIFSVFILRLVGYDILRIPGFQP